MCQNGEMLKNVGENIKNIFAVIFFYTIDITNTIFNPKFYQHFVPSLDMTISFTVAMTCIYYIQCRKSYM